MLQSTQDFLNRFNIRIPVIQAPMAGVSTPRLAAAVSNAGGLGSLGIGASTPAQARQMITDTRAMTDAPFNVNVFCHAPAQRSAAREADWSQHLAPLFSQFGREVPTALSEIYLPFQHHLEVFELLLDLRPAVVSFHFGLPHHDQLAAFRRAGIRTMATATNLQEAHMIEQAGIDAIVAQGIEAGGHRGMFDPSAPDEGLSTAVLTRLLARQTRRPVIAAGGIMDGQGVQAALALGAAAAQLGTAFLLCPESAADAAYRKNLKSSRARTTRMTSVISGQPARGLTNSLILHGEADNAPLPAAYPVAYDAAKQLQTAAASSDNHEFAAHWAGQGAPMIRELPASDLMAQIIHEWRAQGAQA